eukprot:SAG31_NODE_39515_length_287_cov_1.367021_1_plen_28_part_10
MHVNVSAQGDTASTHEHSFARDGQIRES